MRITPVPHGLEDLVGKSPTPRTEGLHVSTIYNSLYQTLEPDRYRKGTAPDPLILEAGLAFESFLEDALRARLLPGERPPEFTHHEPGIETPILFNPDLILFNGHTRVGELKLTWASCSSVPREESHCFPQKFEKYFCQMLAYCHCLETPYARLVAYFVNGDYRWMREKNAKIAPQLLAWDVEFTPREIAENWQMLIGWARKQRML